MGLPPKDKPLLTLFGDDDGEVTSEGENPLPPPCTGPVRLIVVAGFEAGRRFVVTGGATIGRAEECSVPISDPTVSRLHARLVRDSQDRVVIENRSRKHTLVNGRKIESQLLCFGDKIQLNNQVALLVAPHHPAERKKLEQDRMQAVGYLTTGIAHDFNNVLGAALLALGYLDRLPQAATLDDPEVEACRLEMREGLLRSAKMVSRLLSFAQRGSAERRECDLAPLSKKVLHLIRNSFGGSIEVVSELAPGLRVRGDRTQLSQLLLNLCLNARDAMEAGGTLTVRTSAATRHEDEYVVITVEDTGVGMDEATRERIFEKFFTTKRTDGGTGLGLATVREVARWHGGFVEVQSAPGRGSAFTVYLPRMSDETRRERDFPTVEGHVPSEVTDRGGRILVVDDDAMMCRSTARLLRQAGHQVESVADGLEAIAHYAGSIPKPDIVLLETDMPRVDGREVFQRLRRVDPEVRVIFVSGDSAAAWEARLRARGAVGFLEKPFEAKRLLGAVSSALSI